MSHESPRAETTDPDGGVATTRAPAVSGDDARVHGDDAYESGPDRARDTTDGPGDDEPDELDEFDDDERRSGAGPGLLANIWGGIKEIVIIAVMAIVLSFIVKSWLIQAFYIPSESMENTLVINDRVIVSKLTPGPIDLQRGDVVVFQDPGQWLPVLPSAADEPGLRGSLHRGLQFVGLLPDDSDDHLIKRVIGLPGDHVVGPSDGGKITVNGEPVTENYIKPGDTPNDGLGKGFDIVVPAGKVWVMGDHRGDSADSRYHDDGTGATGSVPVSDITGRAVLVVWPIDHVRWLSVPESTYAKVPAATTPTGTGTATGTATSTAKATTTAP